MRLSKHTPSITLRVDRALLMQKLSSSLKNETRIARYAFENSFTALRFRWTHENYIRVYRVGAIRNDGSKRFRLFIWAANNYSRGIQVIMQSRALSEEFGWKNYAISTKFFFQIFHIANGDSGLYYN